jgi:superfamily II DNA or RNA helicase
MIKLYEYQKRYLDTMPKRGIMAADTGTGKTFMALEHYRRHGGGAPLLILAPASKVRTGDWERDIEEYFRDLPQEDKQFSYEIYSYERFSRDPSNKQFLAGKRAIWQKFSPKHGGTQHAIIADEIHRAKSWKSGIGKSLVWCGKDAKFFCGLSATPLPNGWIDFANYSKLWGFTKGITDFKNKYCDIVTYKGFPEIKGYWHEDELMQQWQSISRKLSKKDALDLPDRTFIGVDFKRPTEYMKTMLDRRNAEGEVLDSAPKLTHALRQTLTDPKLSYLEEIIEGTDENVVIFYNYNTEREAILDMLNKKFKDRPIYRQDGEKHELPSKPQWGNVKRSVTVSHYKSGSTGVEMTYATQVIYFSPTYSYAEYLQSIGRVFRNGQTEKTTFYNFRTPNSIEEDIYTVLKTKNDFQIAQWFEKNIKEDE